VGDATHDALPDVGFLIPNLVHDAHDASLASADAWLRQQLTPVLESADFTSGKLIVVVTADEDDKHSGNVVLTSVLTPRIHHKVVTTPLTHYSLTRYIAQVLGVTPLRNGASAPDMGRAFGL
jgi:acid phosphatase